MKEAQNNTVIDVEKLLLLNVKVFKAYLEANKTFRDAPQAVHEYTVETATDSAFNFKDKLCRFRLFLKISALDHEKNQLGMDAEYGIEFHFHIENLNDYLIHKEGNEVQVDNILVTNLCAISYSTARGIILERMHGTYFDGVILPIVDAGKILHEDKKKPIAN